MRDWTTARSTGFTLLAVLGLVGCGNDGGGKAPPLTDTGGGSTDDGGDGDGDGNGDGDGGMPRAWSVSVDFPANVEGANTLCDLDGDGQLELVVALSNPDADAAVAVFDARTGNQAWVSAFGDGGFSAPLCDDVNDDGTLDVLVGGRGSDVFALSGTDGARLWGLEADGGAMLDGNTYTVVETSDQAPELFVTSGGGGGDRADIRVPGRVTAFDRQPSVVATWDEPDGAEIYASPAVEAVGGRVHLGVGSGGETLPGRLWWLTYDRSSATFTVEASVDSQCSEGGFPASPTFIDLDDDGVVELVGVTTCGQVVAMDATGTERWRVDASEAVGIANPVGFDADGDGDADVLAAFSNFNPSLPFPAEDRTEVMTLDGRTGEAIWIQDFQYQVQATPSLADVDGDGVPDVWLSTSALNSSAGVQVLSGSDGLTLREISATLGGGTPELWDVDDDGSLDLFLSQLTESSSGNQQGGTRVVRVSTGAPGPVVETGFRGHGVHDGRAD